MHLSQRRASSLSLLRGLAVALALGAPAAAQPASISISFDKALYNANDTITLTITGAPGDVPLMLASFSPGPTTVPGIGTLGVGLPVPAMYLLPSIPVSGKLVFSCQTNCDMPIIGDPVFFQVLTFTPGLKGASGLSNGTMLLVLSGDCAECVDEAVPDPNWTPWPHTQAMILYPLGIDFQMVAGGQFTEYAEGSAHLTGVVARASDPSARFVIDATFSDRLVVGDPGFLPLGSPKQELDPGAYAASGGPISPLLWRYYQTLEGTLTGIDGYAGGKMAISRIGPSFQVGYGANGKNLNMGASGWFDVEILSQPTTGATFPAILQADFNIDVGGNCPMCPSSTATHALYLPGIGTSFVFEGSPTWVTDQCGTASLHGSVVASDDPAKKFFIDVAFLGKVSSGNAAYPPAGSPKLELDPSAYSANGGPVDPGNWHYYTTVVGTLTGQGDYLGAMIDITRFGPAFQVGFGANGKSLQYGASGWLDVSVVQQPWAGPALQPSGPGDININLEECP